MLDDVKDVGVDLLARQRAKIVGAEERNQLIGVSVSIQHSSAALGQLDIERRPKDGVDGVRGHCD